MSPRRPLRAVADQPERALALVRVSKERDGMISPELQDTAINDYAARTGRRVVHRMEGLDESGSRTGSRWWARLDQAVDMVEAGDIDVILVWKFSRTSRNRLKWAVALDRVEAAGGRLESATEQVDVTTSTGRFTRGMLAELAAFEAERIGEQWKETQARRRALGLPHSGGYRPGYVYGGKEYRPDPDTAPLVVEAFERYVAGMGTKRLAEWLRLVGLPSRGGPWTFRSALRMLDSGWAAGMLHVHDRECGCPNKNGACERRVHVPGAHEPIISSKLWEAFRVEHQRRGSTPRRLLTARTPLSGLVRCAACGYGMRFKLPGRTRSNPLYQCSHVGCVNPTSVVVRRAEEAAVEWLRAYAEDVERAAAVAASDRAARVAAKSSVTRLARSVNQLDAEMVTLAREYARGMIPEATYVTARDELVRERVTAQAALEGVTQQLGPARPSPAVAAQLVADWDTLSVAGCNAVCRSLLMVVVARGERQSTVSVVPSWEWTPPAS